MRKNGIQRTPSAERLVWMLSIVIPQRLAWMRVAQDMVALQQKHPGLPGMKVAIEVGNGEFEHAYDGCLTTLTDNAISMAIFHGRSLLEFLGLGISPNRPPLLSAKQQRGPGDVGIEHYANSLGPLERVTPDAARRAFQGKGKADPTSSWETLLAIANQRLAHSTDDFSLGGKTGLESALDAFESIPELVRIFLYDALGHPRP